MAKILIPRSDSLSVKTIEPSDWEKYFSSDLINDYVVSGFTLTAGTGLSVNIAVGIARLKGLFINNTTSSSKGSLTASNTNYIYVTLARDSNSEAESWSFTSNTSGTTPTDSLFIGTATTDGSGVTAVGTIDVVTQHGLLKRDAYYFGDGHDGDVTISSNTTLTEFKEYNNLTINSGVTLSGDRIIIQATGTVTVNGTISVNGGGGSGAGGGGGGAGGVGNGGNGSSGGSPANGNQGYGINSSGGSGGNGGNGSGGYNGQSGGGGGTGSGVNSVTFIDYKIDSVRSATSLPIAFGGGGGAGAGGGGGGGYDGGMQPTSGGAGGAGGGGGDGGGSILIIAKTINIASGGVISSNGDNGGNGSAGGNGGTGISGGNGAGGGAGGGGGGAGGMIMLIYQENYTNNGSMTVTGGSGGTGSSGGSGGTSTSTGRSNGSSGGSGVTKTYQIT